MYHAYANESELTLEQSIAQYQSQFRGKNCLLKIKVKTRELIIQRTNLNNQNNHKNNQNHNNQNNNQNQQNACLIQ